MVIVSQYEEASKYMSSCVNKKYKLGAYYGDRNEYIDCVSFIEGFVRKVYGDKNGLPETYAELCRDYEKEKYRCVADFYAFIKARSKLLTEGEIYVGDIMVMFSDSDKLMATGINSGNSKVLIITEKDGPVSTRYSSYGRYEGYRWLRY